MGRAARVSALWSGTLTPDHLGEDGYADVRRVAVREHLGRVHGSAGHRFDLLVGEFVVEHTEFGGDGDEVLLGEDVAELRGIGADAVDIGQGEGCEDRANGVVRDQPLIEGFDSFGGHLFFRDVRLGPGLVSAVGCCMHWLRWIARPWEQPASGRLAVLR